MLTSKICTLLRKGVSRFTLGHVSSFDSTKNKYTFRTYRFNELNDEDLKQCSDLFSNHYGKYSEFDPSHKKGDQIKMSPLYYKSVYANLNKAFISICKDRNTIVGHVIYILDKLSSGKNFCWVTQLVVHTDYRRLGIGQKLLNSAWCFSDLDIRGLATANSITLNILETVSWRTINIEWIKANIDDVKELLQIVPFANADNIILSDNRCQVFSAFYPIQESSNDKQKLKHYKERLGEVKPGYEWLGLVFNDQDVVVNSKDLDKYLDFSEEALLDSYNRMNISDQPWAKSTGAREEVSFILSYIKDKMVISSDMSILDIGCGIGRHSIEFAKQGFNNITAIDFAESQLSIARKSAENENLTINFANQDARYFTFMNKYDLILCLYDVIGSFRSKEHNQRIIRKIHKHLKPGGLAVISVMNLDANPSLVQNAVSISNNPERLIKLHPSTAMGITGEVFDDAYLFNSDDKLVYRKEQFRYDHQLHTEYIIASKRYKKDAFEKELKHNGFIVEKCFYAKAGKWKASSGSEDSSLKEIVYLLRKEPNLINKLVGKKAANK